MIKLILTLALTIFILSCATQKQTNSKPNVYWVNSLKVSCSGVGQMQCLQIQKSKTIEKGKWLNFYSPIEDFKFEPGYIYKLSVTEQKLNPSQVPADSSSKKYMLVEVLEKRPDPKFRIQDIWALEAINGQIVEKPDANDRMQTPSIEINLTEMRIMGTDGCNTFFGPIKNIEVDELKFGPLGATMKMCYNMDIPNRFNVAMNKVSNYKIENLKLYFFDNKETELLRFKKVD